MISRTVLLAWVVGAGAIAGTMAVCVPRTAGAAAAAERDVARFHEVATAAAELADLARRSPSDHPPASDGKLALRISAAISAAGLPAASLSSLSPESASTERLDGGLRLIRRRATLMLTPLTLPQVGRFLDAWRMEAPGWTVSRIDLEPRRETSSSSATGGDLPLRAVIVIETLNLADTGPRN